MMIQRPNRVLGARKWVGMSFLEPQEALEQAEQLQLFYRRGRAMRKMTPCIVSVTLLLTACAPSLQYRIGQGFYSDTFAKAQMQAAANAGKVKNLGRFSVEGGGCFLYSQDTADREVVIPAIQEKLKEMGANVADSVVANEQGYDFLLGLLIIPGFLGCSNWTISGEALLVEQTAM